MPSGTDFTLHETISRLDRIFESAKSISDDELKSHYAKYLCILTCGFLEESIKKILRSYVNVRANRTISNYFTSSAKHITNLNVEKIVNLLGSFNEEWRQEIVLNITDEEKDSIDSIVANRHLIAHGQNVGVSFVRVNIWYINAKKVITKIDNIVNSQKT